MQVGSEAGLMLVIRFPGIWPPHSQSYGQEWYSERSSGEEAKAAERGWNNTSFDPAVDVWVFKFSTTAGNNGKVQGNEDTRVSLPYLLSETGPRFAAFMHTKDCPRRKKNLSCCMPCKVLQETTLLK